MGSRRAVRLARRFVRYRLRRQSADLRVPCRDGPGKGRSRHILRIYQNDPAAYQKSGLQHDSIDGGRRTPLLRQFRIPCQQFFRPVVALRHSGRTESPGAQGACDGVGGDYGSGPFALREKYQRRAKRARRHGSPLFAGRQSRRSSVLGLEAVRLRQGAGASFPALQHQILADGVSFRRVPFRRGHVDDLLSPRLHGVRQPREIFQPGGQRRGAMLPDAGQPINPRPVSARRHDCRGRQRYARHVRRGRRGRGRVRLPARHGRARLLDQTAERSA